MQTQSNIPIHDAGDLPGTVKIDLDTPLEQLWKGMAFLSLIACIVILFIGYIGGEDSPPDPEFLRFLPWAIGAGILFLFLRRFTNNYYLADTRRKAIYYHFEFGFTRSVREYMRFADVDSVIVNGTLVTTEESKWYQYQLILIDRSGQVYPFSDSLLEEKLGLLNERAATLSKLIGCRLVPGQSEHVHTMTATAGVVTIATAHTPLEQPGAVGCGVKFGQTALRFFLVVEVLVILIVIFMNLSK
ncbi:MAG TPA: hypothetical protein PLU72_02955 [Candidatus Ozemobacteraceae bacterium]|nr:hypothetical protein [Candidatus Ozemobacteraceae bacterium]HQG29495.1 hypothetical protein [Candidatus Ozemobacteraceae bacterium]